MHAQTKANELAGDWADSLIGIKACRIYLAKALHCDDQQRIIKVEMATHVRMLMNLVPTKSRSKFD